MKKQVYKIDENGYLQEILIKEFDEGGNCIEELEENIITTDIPQGLYRPKWTGTEWIETMTEAEYIATLPLPKQTKELTIEERLQQLETLTVNNISNQIEIQIMRGEL